MRVDDASRTAPAPAPAPALTNLEKLALRLRTLPRCALVSLTLVLDREGLPVVWAIREIAEAEGLATH